MPPAQPPTCLSRTAAFRRRALIACVALASAVGLHASWSGPAGAQWQPLFDGTQLAPWRLTPFVGQGTVTVRDDEIRLGAGHDLTGITWAGGDLPTTDYELALRAMRVEGSDFFAGVTFPVGDAFCSLILGGWGGQVVGLSSINGRDASENDTTQSIAFESHRWYDVRIRVTPEAIEAWLDDRRIVQQDVPGHSFTTRLEVEPSQPLGVAAWRTSAAIRDIRLRRLTSGSDVEAPPDRPARLVAITIDDLPRGGDGGATGLAEIRTMTERLLRPFRDQQIPVTGFVNEGRTHAFGAAGLRQILDVWLDHGADLGNHSYSHLDLNAVPLDQYTADIVRGEPVTRAALEARGRTLRYYRHPFLRTGPTLDVKRGLQTFLDAHGYRVAPVTLDNADYLYASLDTRPAYRERVRREYVPYMESVVAFFETRTVEVVGRDIPQVLLLHANELNADRAPALITMFRSRGYGFVSLDEALADQAYSLAEQYAGRGGFSWIHRWSRTKGLARKGEPEPPAWASDAFAAR